MSYKGESDKANRRSKRPWLRATLLLISLSILGGAISPLRAELSSNATVFATGLDYPRGLKFGPDGNLYVAEAGRGGPNSSANFNCPQDEFVGPFSGGNTARISRVSPIGVRTTFADGLPSAQGNASLPGFVLGVSDVAFLGQTLYALLGGGGCAHGNPDVPAGILRVNSNGSWNLIADLNAFQRANPVANPSVDFDPDGTWYSLVAAKGIFTLSTPTKEI